MGRVCEVGLGVVGGCGVEVNDGVIGVSTQTFNKGVKLGKASKVFALFWGGWANYPDERPFGLGADFG